MSDWQANNLKMFRELVFTELPGVTEDQKWGVPVFMVNGKLICAMSTFKNHTKFNFFKGAFLSDDSGLFNSGLDSKEHRSINLAEGEIVDTQQLAALIQQAAKYATTS